MYRRVFSSTGLALVAGVLPFVALDASAGPDKIAFPAAYRFWVNYATVDRYDNKQVRELYTSAEAAQAAKTGKSLPHGTTIVMAIYKAQVDAQGNPIKNADGRFIKGELANVAVMEKRPGWAPSTPTT